jgi:hypothetical protein
VVVVTTPAVAHAVPTDPLYSILLLLHVGTAVVGFGALALTGVQARRARKGPDGDRADGVRRFFRPGINWAARALYAVPVLGFGLISASKGAFAANDGFVLAGLGLWGLATVVAEFVVWPGERRIQEVVSTEWTDGRWIEGKGTDGRFETDCGRVAAAAAVLSVVFVVAVVLMVGRP